MSISLILLLIILILLLILNVPVWAALVFSAIPYFIIENIPLTAIPSMMSTGQMTSFLLLAFPLFTLAGKIMNESGVTERIFDFANTNVGWIRGGLGHVNVLASMLFAGMSGSAIADISRLGNIEIQGMTKKGYDLEFSCGVTLASATIGPIIPPSAAIILYAVIAGESVAKLFIGGIIPGLLMGISLMVMIYFITKNKKYPLAKKPTILESLKSWKKVILPLLNPVIIVLGMTGGFFTPTEAAAVAVLYSVILGVFVYHKLTLKKLFSQIKETAVFCSSVYVLIAGALIISFILTRENIANTLVDTIMSINLPPAIIIFALSLITILLGCFVEVTALILLILPVMIPIIHALEVSTVFFGVVFIMSAILGILTPPFGLGLYVVSDMTGLSFKKTIKAVAPFLLPLFLVIVLLIVFPQIVTFLPNLL